MLLKFLQNSCGLCSDSGLELSIRAIEIEQVANTLTPIKISPQYRLNIESLDGHFWQQYDSNSGAEDPLERSRIEKQGRAVDLQRSNVSMTEAEQIPVATL